MFDAVPGHDLETATEPAAAAFDLATLTRYRGVLARVAKPYVVRDGRAMSSDYPPRGILSDVHSRQLALNYLIR